MKALLSILVPGLLFLCTSLVFAQDQAQPHSKAAPGGKSSSNKPSQRHSLLVTADVACEIDIDGETDRKLIANKPLKIPIGLGDHKIIATTESGWSQKLTVRIDKTEVQKAVDIEMASAIARDSEGEAAELQRVAQMQARRRADAAEKQSQCAALYRDNHPSETIKVAKDKCDSGDAAGCTCEASFYFNGNGVTKDNYQAAALYAKGCEGGDALGCYRVGKLYTFGPTQDLNQALTYFRKGCEEGDPDACWEVGVIYRDGRSVARDRAQAFIYFRKACDGGDESGCTSLKELDR